MSYEVVGVGEDNITIWDGRTRDVDHPEHRAGEMTVFVGPGHPFRTGQKVLLQVRLADTGPVSTIPG